MAKAMNNQGISCNIPTGAAQPLSDEGIMLNKFTAFLRNESGATAIEYGLVAGLIGVVVITAVTRVGTKVSNQFVTLGNALK